MADLSGHHETIGFIGAGNMAGALIRGLIRAGLPPAQIRATDTDSAKTAALARELSIGQEIDGVSVVAGSDVIVLALKPGLVCSVAQDLASSASDKLWISVAAGVTTSQLEDALGSQSRVVRAMPNTPALVGQGATALCGGSRATDQDLQLAEVLLSAAGITARVSEGMMDAVTGLSGSGPAFVMMIIEAMTDGAVRSGLPRPLAQTLAAQTVKGAAVMLQETGKHPGELKDMVTSPAGTTIAGVEALEAAGLRSALIAGVTAAAHRSRELSGK